MPQNYLFVRLAYVSQDFIAQLRDWEGMLSEGRKMLPFLIKWWAFFQTVSNLIAIAKYINAALFRI